MCGIAGYFGWDLAPEAGREALSRMCAALEHRGPDDRGLAVFEGSGMAMRRLSIVDLAGGKQPVHDPGRDDWLVYNGEIYNHRELGTRLAAQGEPLRTTCDTEVLLRQLVRHGTDGLAACNGMFAFAWQRRADDRLILGRDRVGIKPLYYWCAGDGRLLYASEIKALLASGLIQPELEPRALWDYLGCRYVPAPRTMWRHIFKLPPGHVLELRAGQAAPTLTRYWDYPTAPPRTDLTDAACDADFARLFTDAVRRRLEADVPVGILLSGGLDSSAVAAVAAAGKGRVETFSVAFDGSPDTDERAYARQVAAHIGSHHHEIAIRSRDILDYLPRLVRDTDEPLADLACIPLYHVCRLAREHVTVVLAGEGSDELLGGYDLHVWMDFWDKDPTDYRFRRVPNMTDYLDGPAKTALTGLHYPDTLAPLARELRALGPRHPLEQRLRVLCRDWLVEDLLMKADKMSMACSLELRVPFLDHRLVEWAWSLPPELKIGPDGRGGRVTKRMLRRFARGRLPDAILDRTKMGFPVPLYDWLSGPLAGLARDLVGRPDSWLRGHCDSRELAGYLERGLTADAPILDRHRLWNLMILELWGRAWRVG